MGKISVQSKVDFLFFLCFLTDNTYNEMILAVVLLGEPIHWETSLQIITDILLTHGNPNIAPHSSTIGAHIPIIACNKDLVFKAVADLPRFGHGAFLTCLEALYKVTFDSLFTRGERKRIYSWFRNSVVTI